MADGSAQAKDADPREAFYEQHHRRVAAFIQRRIADPGIAEQVEQQTWAHLMRQWDTLRLPEVVLMRIAWRRIVDIYESNGRTALTLGDEILEAAVERQQLRTKSADTVDPGSTVPSRVDLQRAITALTSRQRQVLTLIGVDRLTRRQVAGLLNIGEETVKTLYGQARTAMRTSPALAGYDQQRATTQEVTR
ncbi:RNA polymerase sigma factor [Micromonospora craterilacus]|uniref:RNA polymerase sigma factor n=1 Tax=Micromonospora craterilacus TaxID=1655439 RepID=UPI001313D810|nr:sigma-70 family RNA polymerase sigma factor [Micromonospora craterilacus]